MCRTHQDFTAAMDAVNVDLDEMRAEPSALGNVTVMAVGQNQYSHMLPSPPDFVHALACICIELGVPHWISSNIAVFTS